MWFLVHPKVIFEPKFEVELYFGLEFKLAYFIILIFFIFEGLEAVIF